MFVYLGRRWQVIYSCFHISLETAVTICYVAVVKKNIVAQTVDSVYFSQYKITPLVVLSYHWHVQAQQKIWQAKYQRHHLTNQKDLLPLVKSEINNYLQKFFCSRKTNQKQTKTTKHKKNSAICKIKLDLLKFHATGYMYSGFQLSIIKSKPTTFFLTITAIST